MTTESQDDRFAREWASVDLVRDRALLVHTINHHNLNSLEDVDMIDEEVNSGDVLHFKNGIWSNVPVAGLSISHSLLVDLESDDHLNYLNEARADDIFYRKAVVDDLQQQVHDLQTYPLAEYGFHTVSAPLASADATLTMGQSKFYLARMYVAPGRTISNISFYMKTAGAMHNANDSGVAIYSNAGQLIESIANYSLFDSVGWKTATLVNSIQADVIGNFYWIGILSSFLNADAVASEGESPWNGGVSSAHRRSISKTSVTAFPSSFNPSTYSLETSLPFLALG